MADNVCGPDVSDSFTQDKTCWISTPTASLTKFDLLLILSHIGLNQDKLIANEIPNIDIIIGGHSHSALKECVVENGTLICQAGQYGEFVGELTIEYDEEREEIVHHKSNLILANQYPENQND